MARASGLDAIETTEIVESAPVLIQHAVPRELALAMLAELREVGAEAISKPTGTWTRPGRLSRLAPNQLSSVISPRRRRLSACLKKRNGGLGPGEHLLVVGLLIQKNGRVKAARLRAPEKMLGTQAATCVVKQLKRLRFPKNDVASRIDRQSIGPLTIP